MSVDADHLARSGWLCLRIEAHDLRREDVLLPAKYRTVNVFLGDGAGAFALASAYPVGSEPAFVAVADLDRDGRPDRAIGFISGKVGSPLSRGSAGMLAICKRAGTPVAVYREDGVET